MTDIIAPRTADGEYFVVGMTVYFVNEIDAWGMLKGIEDIRSFVVTDKMRFVCYDGEWIIEGGLSSISVSRLYAHRDNVIKYRIAELQEKRATMVSNVTKEVERLSSILTEKAIDELLTEFEELEND